LLQTDWCRRRLVTPYRPVAKQAIATTGFGLQQSPIGTERLADGHRMHLKRVFQNNRARPDAVHQLILGDEFAGRLGQHFDHFERASTDRYQGSQDTDFAPREVNLALA
jgi:hypothetical protein